jgi:hypothetical protein
VMSFLSSSLPFLHDERKSSIRMLNDNRCSRPLNRWVVCTAVWDLFLHI